MINKNLFTSNSDEWRTPVKLFQELDQEYNFTLDPCSTKENHLCKKYFTRETDGLLQSWENQIVFCNPPYSAISKWVEKCYNEFIKNNITIVLLIPARTDTKYFHNYIYGIAELRFLKGRLKFNDGKGSVPFPSMICIYHGNKGVYYERIK